MPAVPGAGLEVIEPQIILGALEALLDRPAQACDSRQSGQGGAWGRDGQVVGRLAGVGSLATHQKPVLEAPL